MSDVKGKTFLCRPDWYDPGDEKEIRVGPYDDEEDAAKKFAEWHDSHGSEYPEEQVVVVIAADGIEKRFDVFAHQVREYSARPAKVR